MGFAYSTALPSSYAGDVWITILGPSGQKQVVVDHLPYERAIAQLDDLFASHAEPRRAYVTSRRLDSAALPSLERIAIAETTVDLPDPVVGLYFRQDERPM